MPNTDLSSVGQKALRDGHSSGTPIAERLEQPTRAAGLETHLMPRVAARIRPPLFGLAPGGVCPAADVAAGAVRSYRTLSPLPRRPKPQGGLLSVALSLGSPPAAVSRHRVSMEPGLSSTGTALAIKPAFPAAAVRPTGRVE